MTAERFLFDRVALHCDDCRDVFATLPENSLDACVTDPPYHLTSKSGTLQLPTNNGGGGTASPFGSSSRGFMGKVWDGGDVAFRPETWAAVYRVLKPGAHLIAMGGTRTYHRLACAIEDAGFEIRDTVSWLYGSGFPKSHDVSKGIDRRKDWSALPKLQMAIASARKAIGISQSEAARRMGLIATDGDLGGGGFMWFETGLRMPTREQWPALKTALGIGEGFDRCFEQAEREITGTVEEWQNRSNYAMISADGLRRDIPATDAAREWQGWGTALKPACELIVLARKPLSEGTVAANVLRWGTGAININACRVGFAGADDEAESKEKNRHGDFETGPRNNLVYGRDDRNRGNYNPPGRWPANLLHDGSDEVVAAFPESEGGAGGGQSGRDSVGAQSVYGQYKTGGNGSRADRATHDFGSAARFFYAARPNEIEQVVITWISDSEPQQATLLVDTGQLLEKATVVSASTGGNGWNTFLSGSTLTDLFRAASTCTIRTVTDSTIGSRIWNYLISLLTSAFTADVNYETANGGSHVANAAIGTRHLIITLGETVSLPGANRVMSGTRLKISVSAATEEQVNSAKRFWYGSKADANDRLGARHPTVKPLDLMQWLCRLVCPPGGKILDCFAGTGTTGEAAWREGMSALLIEAEPEYQADIRRRMALVLAGPDERQRESIKARNLPRDDGPLFAHVSRETWAEMWQRSFDFSQEPGP